MRNGFSIFNISVSLVHDFGTACVRGLTDIIKDYYSTVAMMDTDSSDISSTSDVNESDIDFDTPNTTDMKFSDVSDDPCDERPIKNVSFERVRPFFYSNFLHRLCPKCLIWRPYDFCFI